MTSSQPRILTVVSRKFGQNTYIAWMEGRNDCLVVDPGLEPKNIIEAIQEYKLTPSAMLITHGHSDHIGGNAAMKKNWPECPIVIGAKEVDKLTDPAKNLSAKYGTPIISPAADRLVNEGDVIEYAGFSLEVLEIPGHSSGHVVFIWMANDPRIVFGGDVLFAGAIGRTDFPDGDYDQLATGIREKLFTLPDNTVVLSGHGPVTTIGKEKQTNPFVRPL
jgi:hydroxyacylglutathione hydrolase